MTGPIRVLVVDDHLLFAQTLADALDRLPGYHAIGIAVTGPQALAMAHRARPDLIVLDYHLPGYDAQALLPRLAQIDPKPIVVVITADTSPVTEARALAAGADTFLTKDKAFEDIAEALDRSTRRAAPEARPGAWSTNSIFTDDTPPPIPDSQPEPEVEREVEVEPPSQVQSSPAPEPEPVLEPEPEPLATVAFGPSETVEEHISPWTGASLTLRLSGVSSFAQVVRIERFIERIGVVSSVWLRDLDADVASLSVTLREGHTPAELSEALVAGSRTLRLASVQPGLLDVQVEWALVSG